MPLVPGSRPALKSATRIRIQPVDAIVERPGSIVSKAANFAAKAHLGQTRKSNGLPYIVHPYRVAKLVEEHGGSYEQVAAAWCHDVLEDCPDYVDALAEVVTPPIVRLVEQLTKDPGTKGELMRLYLKQLSPAAAMIQMADRIDNLNDIPGTMGLEWVADYLDESRAIAELCGAANDDLRTILLVEIQHIRSRYHA